MKLTKTDGVLKKIEFCCNGMAYALLDGQILAEPPIQISDGSFIFAIRQSNFSIFHCPYCGAEIVTENECGEP